MFVVQIILKIREGIDKRDWSGSRLPINYYPLVQQVRLFMFSLLAGTMAAIAVLMVLLIRWSKILNKEVRLRTRKLFESERRKRELEESYETMKRYLDEALEEVSVWKKRRS